MVGDAGLLDDAAPAPGIVPRKGADAKIVARARIAEVRHQVIFSHSLNARGRSIASGETVVSPAKHKRDNAEAIFS